MSSSAGMRNKSQWNTKGEYSVVQLTDDTGWRWEARFADGTSKSGVTPISRAAAIKLAEYEIGRTLKDRK
jgi:hypothetical protein